MDAAAVDGERGAAARRPAAREYVRFVAEAVFTPLAESSHFQPDVAFFEELAAEALGVGDVFDPSEGDKTGLVHGVEPEVAAAAALLAPAELLVRAAAAAIYEEDDEAKLLAAVRKAEAS